MHQTRKEEFVLRTQLNEINMVRALACIAVVLTHSITNFIVSLKPDINGADQYITFLRFILLAATPIFILISEALISRNYQNGVPKGFLKKRFRYILIPYILVGLLYAYMNSGGDLAQFLKRGNRIVIQGYWHGFFVLVIFQFYILHMMLGKFLNKVKPWVPILVSFALTFAHQYSFDRIDAYHTWFMETYPLSHRTFIIAWLFYFVVGYYVGRYYETLFNFLGRHWWIPSLGAVVSYWIMMRHVLDGTFIVVTSDRYDIHLYAVSVFLFLIVLFRKSMHFSPMLAKLSHFSYFIYLIHMAVLPTFRPIVLQFNDKFIFYVIMLSFLTIAVSIGWAMLFYETKLTKLFTGKIKILEPQAK